MVYRSALPNSNVVICIWNASELKYIDSLTNCCRALVTLVMSKAAFVLQSLVSYCAQYMNWNDRDLDLPVKLHAAHSIWIEMLMVRNSLMPLHAARDKWIEITGYDISLHAARSMWIEMSIIGCMLRAVCELKLSDSYTYSYMLRTACKLKELKEQC